MSASADIDCLAAETPWRQIPRHWQAAAVGLFLSILAFPFDLLPVGYPIHKLSYYFLIPAGILLLPQTIDFVRRQRFLLPAAPLAAFWGWVIVAELIAGPWDKASAVALAKSLARGGIIVWLGMTFAVAWSIFPRPVKNNVFYGGILGAAALCTVWSLLEIMHLSGSCFAKNMIETVTPCIRQVATNNDWWPPLFFDNRIRGLFAEPSYYAFFLVSVWAVCDFRRKTVRWLTPVMFLLACLLGLTQSRTGMALLLGVAVFLIFCRIVFKSYRCNGKKFLSDLVLYAGCLAAVMLTCRIFPLGHPGAAAPEGRSIRAVIESGSTSTRKELLQVELMLIKERPVAGYGINARSQAMLDRFQNYPRADQLPELANWINAGVFPVLNVYTAIAVDSGVPAAVLFALLTSFPLWYLFYGYFRSGQTPSGENLMQCALIVVLLLALLSGDFPQSMFYCLFWGWGLSAVLNAKTAGDK